MKLKANTSLPTVTKMIEMILVILLCGIQLAWAIIRTTVPCEFPCNLTVIHRKHSFSPLFPTERDNGCASQSC